MGNNYANLNIRSVTQAQLADALTGMNVRAFVGPVENGWCCFTSQELEFTEKERVEICQALSVLFQQPALYFSDADDDVLEMELYEKVSPSQSTILVPAIMSKTRQRKCLARR